MKKLYTLILGALFTVAAYAQNFSDDFEAYAAGDFIAEANSAWSTWGEDPGGADDSQVSSDQSLSGDNSLYFFSDAAGGGPADVILPFGGLHTDGLFTIEFQIYVDADHGAYFNFQGEAAPGGTWSLDAFILQDSTFSIFSNDATDEQFNSTYVPETWWKLAFNINLADNVWEVLQDDVSLGTFENATNSIASMDIFPWNGDANGGNGMSSFYIDDISFDASAVISTEEIATMETSLSVYPNPTSDILNVSIENNNSSNQQLDIHDLSGKLIESIYLGKTTPNNTIQIATTQYAKGMYVISLISDDFTTNTTFTVK